MLCLVCSRGQAGLIKCPNCTLVWHPNCVQDTVTSTCPDCMHEQVEAIAEANRWAAYLKTSPRLPVINHKMPVRNLKEERPRNLKEERPKVVNPKPETQKADQHEFWCHECGEGGSLLCCDHCVLVGMWNACILLLPRSQRGSGHAQCVLLQSQANQNNIQGQQSQQSASEGLPC